MFSLPFFFFKLRILSMISIEKDYKVNDTKNHFLLPYSFSLPEFNPSMGAKSIVLFNLDKYFSH